jgi:quinol monooxygenase YgiN
MPRVFSILRVTVSSKSRKGVLDLMYFIKGPMCNLPGCMSCHGYQDVDNPNRLTLVEEWESLEDLEKHIATDDYRKKLSILDLSSQPPEILFHTVSETRGMDLITAVRDRGKSKELAK